MIAHEDLQRQETVAGSSNRTLGLVFAAFFLLVAVAPAVRGHGVRLWALALSGGFLGFALLFPIVLTPLNRFWTALGLLLHRITSPIVLAAVFYLVFTPFGWLLRLLGKDYLRLKRAPGTGTYWIPRVPPGPPPESISNQF